MKERMKKSVKKATSKTIKQKEASVVVSTTILQNKEVMSEKEDRERIKIRPFVSATASVGVKYGMTINLGDYSSARIDVMVNSPCYPEEMLQVFNQCCKMGDAWLSREIEKIKGGK